jgi:hypothetical protein
MNDLRIPEPHSPQSQQHPGTASLMPQAYPQAYAALPINAKNAVCPHTGLRHAHLAKLLKPGGQAAGYVRVVSLKEPGARHGKTLFHVGDMLRWLDYLASVQSEQRANSSANGVPQIP